MAAADEFLIFDEVQYTRRDWRNRNKVIVAGKPHWLSIPVHSKGNYDAPIDNMVAVDRNWSMSHWNTITHSYRRAPHFNDVCTTLEPTYKKASEFTLLTEINELFLRTIADFLGIHTPIVRANSVARHTDDPTARLVEICLARGATNYISGPAAKSYIDKQKFDAAGIHLHYANYSNYPVYSQSAEVFEHGVSVIDLLMHRGKDARMHLKSINDRGSFLDAS
jgi:hypothetical protein